MQHMILRNTNYESVLGQNGFQAFNSALGSVYNDNTFSNVKLFFISVPT